MKIRGSDMQSAARISGLVLFLYLILAAATAKASDVHDGAAEAIRDLTDKWAEVSTEGDLDGYLSIVTDDFIWLGSDSGPRYVGRKAVREFLEPFFESVEFSIEKVRSEEVVISADGQFAVHQYYGTAILAAKDGSSTSKHPRKYFDFWRRDTDGKWRCSLHMFVKID